MKTEMLTKRTYVAPGMSVREIKMEQCILSTANPGSLDAMDPNDDKYPRNVEIIGDKRVDEWVRWSVNHRIGSDGKIYAKGEFGYDFA